MQNFGNFNSFSMPPATNPKQPQNNSFGNFGFNQGFAPMNPPVQNLGNIKLDTNMDVAQTIPKPKLKAILNNNERGYYSSLLSQADPINANSVQGKEAVTFFKRSGLGVDILKKIWLIASSNNESLDREEFYVALKLIAFAQNNIEVSPESLAKNITTNLPKFASLVPEKKIEEKVEEIKPPNIPSNTDINLMQSSQSSNDFKKQVSLNPNNYNNPTSLNIASSPHSQISQPNVGSTMMTSNMTAPNPNQNEPIKKLTDVDCKMSLDKLHKYESYFKTLDVNQSGVLGGAEAKDVFLKSGLPTQQLFQIWKLVDTKKEGNLSKGEFMVALHLIMLARQGFQLPAELPRPFLEIIHEYQAPEAKKTGNLIFDKLPEKASMDLMSAGDLKFDDKYSVLDHVEVVHQPNLSGNMEKTNEAITLNSTSNTQFMSTQNTQFMPNQNSQFINNQNTQFINSASIPARNNSQPKPEPSVSENFQQQNALLDQAQNELNTELKKQRSFHSNIIQEKSQDLNMLNGIIENYQKLMKKIQDENQFLLEESKKIEEKKNAALKSIMAYQNNIDILLNKNLEIKQKIFNQTSKAIDDISETAKITLDQINQSAKVSASENQNLTLMQRKQLMQEERDRERIRIEENSIKQPQQQFPRNFDSENFPEVEMKNDTYNLIQKNANIAQVNMQMSPPFKNENNFDQNLNMMGYQNVQESFPISNQNPIIPPRVENDNFNNQSIPQNNLIQHSPPQHFDPTNISNNGSPQRAINEMNLNQKMQIGRSSEFAKNMVDSDQKDFANFGGFDMNQQDFALNNATAGWGEFDTNFKPPAFDDHQNNQGVPQQQQGFGFGGFDSFNFK